MRSRDPQVDRDAQRQSAGTSFPDAGRAGASPIRRAIAYFLIIVSFVVWFSILAVPWLKLSLAQASATVTALIIAGEVTFYGGVALLGKEMWDRIKGLVTPRQKGAT